MREADDVISWDDQLQRLAFRVSHRGALVPCYMHGLDFLRAFTVLNLTETSICAAYHAHQGEIQAAAIAKADAGKFEAELGDARRYISVTARDL